MYTTEKLHRNIIDLCKVTFIRPGARGAEGGAMIPPHSFDIQTIDREWTLCAESQDNVRRWLQILTRAIDEDVAIIPDESHVFAVKAKKDPTAQCVPVDYSTSIRFSAYAVSLFVPDTVGGSPNRLVCRWIYTDFYKWSLVTQNGKLALHLSVFIDETFSQKIEFLFRTIDAPRLAGTLEYCIEKFMATMHLQLELDDRFMDLESESLLEERKMPHTSPDQRPSDYLISSAQQEGRGEDAGNSGSLLGFGSDDLGLAASSESLSFFTPSAPSEFFITPPPASLTPSNLPLTSSQIEAHKTWYLALVSSSHDPLPFYDDGTLQISCTLEFRGSQGRITLLYRNTSPSDTLYSLALSLSPDVSGFLRSQVSPLKSHLIPMEITQQQIMLECIQPSDMKPTVVLSYRSTLWSRKHTLSLPVTVLSFNSPLNLSLNDFHLRWEMLNHPGQEMVELLKPQFMFTFETLKRIVTSVSSCRYSISCHSFLDVSFPFNREFRGWSFCSRSGLTADRIIESTDTRASDPRLSPED